MTTLSTVGARVDTSRGRWILVGTVLGSSIAGIDASVVNVALPMIGRDFAATFAALQWTVTGYTLSLAALILLAGALGDRYGRRRIFLVGISGFTVASALCAVVPTMNTLILARILQGVGGALMTPASLAIIQAGFAPDDRPRAIGVWSGFSGVSTVIAPFVGGWLLDLGTWRWIFVINVPIAALVIAITARHVPESRDESVTTMDWTGSALAVVALAAATFTLTVLPGDSRAGWVYAVAVVAVAAAVAFIAYERRAAAPMLPGSIFRSRPFVVINVMTFFAYGSFGVFSLIFTIALETVSGYGPVKAGSTLLPITIVMLLLSGYSGKLAARIGPTAQLVAGPALCATATLLALQISPDTNFWTVVIPLECVFGLGLAAMVAPLTSVALSAVPSEHAGLASAVNNAVARSAALLWIAALPPVTGLTGASYSDASRFLPGYREVCVICAAGLLLAAALALALKHRPTHHRHIVAPATLPHPLCR